VYRQLPVRVYASRNMDRIMSKWLLLIVVCPLLAVSAFAKHETGFLDRVVTVNGESYRYQVFVPSMWVGRKKWPVILFLHGAGERGSDGLLQTDVGLPHAIREHAADAAYIAVIPHGQVVGGRQPTGASAGRARGIYKGVQGGSRACVPDGPLHGWIRDVGPGG